MWYSSYKAYVIRNNLALLLGVFTAKYFLDHANIALLSYIFSYRLMSYTFGYGTLGIACFNIIYASTSYVNPVITHLNIPAKQYIFEAGPISQSLRRLNVFRLYCSVKDSINKTPVDSSKPPSTAESIFNMPPQNFLAHFSSAGQQTQPLLTSMTTPLHQQQPFDISGPMQFNSIPRLGATNNSFDIPTITATNINDSEMGPATFNLMKLCAMPSPASISSKKDMKRLVYTPCVRPPLKPKEHRERLLWYLSPRPEVIEDFRIEQIIAFQKNTNKFNDRVSRVYYDSMTDALLTKIIKPLADSIDAFNEYLTPSKCNLSNCPASLMSLSMIIPPISIANGMAFNIAEIENFISLDGHMNQDGRQYVIERVKDLSTNKRLASYRFLPKVQGMPTDADIIMHIFTYYLKIKEPYAIPPLIEVEGDLVKFLLIYMSITPELEKWGIFNTKNNDPSSFSFQ